MKINKIYGVYFSATGTTEKVIAAAVKAAGEVTGADCEMICFNAPEKRKETLAFAEGDLVFAGIPVYAGRVPNLLLPFVRDRLVGGGAAAVPVVLYGNRNFDDALIELRNIMEENGFLTVAAGSFVGEHSFSYELGAGRPDAEDLRLAEELGRRAAEKAGGSEMNSGSDGAAEQPEAAQVSASKTGWPQTPHIPVSVPGNDPIRPYYTPRDRHGNHINILQVVPKTDMEKCTRCGLCAELCPLGSLDAEDPSAVNGICMKCGACIKKCPAGAKYIDDPGYLYHKTELEEVYRRRGESSIYL